jgi:hypothetical protein
MTTKTTSEKPTQRLESVFLTGPGDLIYEIPKEVAAKHVVTSERIKELGHLPIAPYSVISKSAETHTPGTVHQHFSPEVAEADVEGRHMAWNPVLGWVWHGNVLFGTARAVDGFFYTGPHYHPYGNELAIFV